ncbi:peptidase inhibitor family I36 protein [Nonomuraea sp. PA05]|uniref:peptidase inhibitor family I36 protein n=1 Tax=Nonomuraea sp. PA05 TaxID=2604466 RepID=UPI0016522FCB|nr:peptidase inhibitor family I36 protein [Nonomuraea sp. PA05]
MRFKRYTTALLTAVAGAAMLTTPATAEAVTGPTPQTSGVVVVADLSECTPGWLCVWEYPNRQGDRYSRKSAGTMELGGVGWRDRISSVWNRRNASVTLVDSRSGVVPDVTLPVPAGQLIPDLGDVKYLSNLADWNNKVDKIILK